MFVFLNIHRSGVLTALAWLVPHETAAISVQVLCRPYNHAPCHFMQSHIRKVYACLAVTCHLHFWQNDRDILRATAVTWGWNGYQNKSRHRKLTLEKKILPLLLQGFEPGTFQSRVQRSNHWAIPIPTELSPWKNHTTTIQSWTSSSYSKRQEQGNENGFRMGPIWGLSGIQYRTHVFLRYITHVSHVDPIYFPYGYHMNARCFPDGSHVNLGLIPVFLDVFY